MSIRMVSKPSRSSSLRLVEANGLEEDRRRVLRVVVYVHSSDSVTSDSIRTALGIADIRLSLFLHR